MQRARRQHRARHRLAPVRLDEHAARAGLRRLAQQELLRQALQRRGAVADGTANAAVAAGYDDADRRARGRLCRRHRDLRRRDARITAPSSTRRRGRAPRPARRQGALRRRGVVDGLAHRLRRARRRAAPKKVCVDTPGTTLARDRGDGDRLDLPALLLQGRDAGRRADLRRPTAPSTRTGSPRATATATAIPDATDDCPNVFNPARPLDHERQADVDGDGVGDACDGSPTG